MLEKEIKDIVFIEDCWEQPVKVVLVDVPGKKSRGAKDPSDIGHRAEPYETSEKKLKIQWWVRGSGCTTYVAFGRRLFRSPANRPVFRLLWWETVARNASSSGWKSSYSKTWLTGSVHQ